MGVGSYCSSFSVVCIVGFCSLLFVWCVGIYFRLAFAKEIEKELQRAITIVTRQRQASCVMALRRYLSS